MCVVHSGICLRQGYLLLCIESSSSVLFGKSSSVSLIDAALEGNLNACYKP